MYSFMAIINRPSIKILLRLTLVQFCYRTLLVWVLSLEKKDFNVSLDNISWEHSGN